MAFKAALKLSANLVLWLSRLLVVGITLFVGYVIYSILIGEIVRGDSYTVPVLALWAISAYIVLPRVHRLLTKFYIPDYFVGRTRTGDGFYGDPVNVALNGSEKQLHAAMQAAGWVLADPLSASSSWKMVKSVVFRKSYPNAPVSNLYLFRRKHDFCYQQEVAGNPHARHHVRFWKTPKGWWLPGGHKADWLAAGTYDRSVGFSAMTLQFTHKIAENVDEERDFIVKTLQETGLVEKVDIKKHFTSSFHARNGGGDRIKTDGSLPFVSLKTQ